MKARKKVAVVDPYNSFSYTFNGMEFASDSEAAEYFANDDNIPMGYEDNPSN